MLEIKDLVVEVAGKQIINGLSLRVGPGEVHAIMGPNGSGKSTLAYVLAGRDGYEVTGGSITLGGQDLLGMEPEERAAAGVFLAMQYPVEVPGVANMYFLRQAMNALRRARGEAEIGAGDFMKQLRAKAKVVGVTDALRTVADGVNGLRSPDRGFIVITHYQRLLEYIVPDQVHVLAYGQIRRSGAKELALELEEGGYAGVLGSEFADRRAAAVAGA